MRKQTYPRWLKGELISHNSCDENLRCSKKLPLFVLEPAKHRARLSRQAPTLNLISKLNPAGFLAAHHLWAIVILLVTEIGGDL